MRPGLYFSIAFLSVLVIALAMEEAQAATHYVYTCEPTSQAEGVDSMSRTYGACASGGSWIEVDVTPWYQGGIDQESFGRLLLTGTLLMSLAYSVHFIAGVMRPRRG